MEIIAQPQITYKWWNTLWSLYSKGHQPMQMMPKGTTWWAILRPHSWCEIKPLICESFHFSFSLPFVGRFDGHPKTSKLHCRIFTTTKGIFMALDSLACQREYLCTWGYKTVVAMKNVTDLQGMKFTRERMDVRGFHLMSPLIKKLAWKTEKSVLDGFWINPLEMHGQNFRGLPLSL